MGHGHLKLVYNADDYIKIKAKVLYRTSNSVRVYDSEQDREIWVPINEGPNNKHYFSGEEVTLNVHKNHLLTG